MTGIDPDSWRLREQKWVCLFLVSDNPLTICGKEPIPGKIVCEDHVGKKSFRKAES